jgi:hypothetical protein
VLHAYREGDDMQGETVTLWGVLGAVGIGVILAVLIAFAINAWKRR